MAFLGGPTLSVRSASVLFNRLRGYATTQSVRIPIDRKIMSRRVERNVAGSKYESREARAASKLFQPGDTVLELGGGLGFISTLLRLKTKVGRIVTVEANPHLIHLIRRTHALNAVADVDVRHGAVIAEQEGLRSPSISIPDFLQARPRQRAHRLSRRRGPGLDWPTLLEDVRPTAVVMDIEGGELQLLETEIGDIRRLIVEIHPAAYGLDGMARVCNALARHGLQLKAGLSSGDVLALERQ